MIPKWLKEFDRQLILFMREHGVAILRVCLGIVFLWFGLLKVFEVTPVSDLIKLTYPFFPQKEFMIVLGAWEVLIGVGLIWKMVMRATIGLLWLQMAGTLFSLVLYPPLFFQNGNVFLLTMEGEFVIKNLVLIAASIVIAGFTIRPSQVE